MPGGAWRERQVIPTHRSDHQSPCSTQQVDPPHILVPTGCCNALLDLRVDHFKQAVHRAVVELEQLCELIDRETLGVLMSSAAREISSVASAREDIFLVLSRHRYSRSVFGGPTP